MLKGIVFKEKAVFGGGRGGVMFKAKGFSAEMSSSNTKIHGHVWCRPHNQDIEEKRQMCMGKKRYF